MPVPYKRVDWNDLIDVVNNVLQNPPDGCDPIDEIPHVDPSHRWAKSDIRTMQDKIKETCDTINFDGIPGLWKQSILNEINEKLAEAWCDCEGCECLFANCEYSAVQGGFAEVFLMNATCDFNCGIGDPGVGKMDWSPVVNGLTVGLPGFRGRTYQVFRFNPGSGEKAFSTPFGSGTTGQIDCDGKIVSTRDTSGTKGMTVFRPDGGSHQLWARLRCGAVSGVPSECSDCDFDPVNCFPPGWPPGFLPGSTTIMVGCCFT